MSTNKNRYQRCKHAGVDADGAEVLPFTAKARAAPGGGGKEGAAGGEQPRQFHFTVYAAAEVSGSGGGC